MAADTLRQALLQSPEDARVHALLAMCLSEQEDFEAATQHARQAVHLAPDDSYVFYVLAAVMADRRRFGEARDAIRQAIEIDPWDAEYFGMLARIEYSQEHWRAALVAAEQGLAIDGEHAGCINLRAMAQVKLGDKAGAAATIDQALARRPDDPVAHANQGWVLLHAGEPKKAMEHFREALRLRPDFEWAQQGIVEALKAQNPLYRVMLAWFLWMGRLPGGARWGIVIGGYIGYQVLRGIAAQSPEWAPLVWPLLILYIAFAVTTWLVVPISSLFLRLHPWGRHALSRDQIRDSNLVGAALFAPFVVVGAAYALGHPIDWIWLPWLGALALPAAGVYRCEAGWPRQAALVALAALAAIGYGVLAFVLVFEKQAVTELLMGLLRLIIWAYIVGIVASQFLLIFLMRVRQQR